MDYKMYGGNFSEGIGKGIKSSFRQGSSLTRLIYINCGVFLLLKILYIFFLLAGEGQDFYDHLMEWVGLTAPVDLYVYSIRISTSIIQYAVVVLVR